MRSSRAASDPIRASRVAANAFAKVACPNCRAVYALRDAHLRGDGLVRCGRCDEVFDAIANRVRVRIRTRDDDSAPRPGVRDFVPWALAALAGILLLGWQIEHFVLPRHADDADYRRQLAAFCRITGCELPPRRDTARLALTHTAVALHPRAPGAVRVTVQVVNHAAFAQPYPALRLTLTDRDGGVVGRRTYLPSAYLRRDQRATLEPGELGTARLDLARPHRRAVGYEIDIVAGA